MNTLYYGDNLQVLREYIRDESIDLIYLDPPFNSNANYNVLFDERDGTRAAAQIQAFEDTWRWDSSAAEAFQETIIQGGKVADALRGFQMILGNSDFLAYLSMMAPRLVELHRVLKPTGSLYLHCDPTASHYLKVILDSIFGPERFLSEIIWKRSHSHNNAKRYGPIHDIILFYSKTKDYTWHDIRLPYSEEYIKKFFKFDDNDGRGVYWTGDLTGSGISHGETSKEWRGFNPTSKKRHWAVPIDELDKLDKDKRIFWPATPGAWPKLKRYLSETKGIPLQDIWVDIQGMSTMSKNASESLGYQTQKPEALLDRILETSSNRDDIILDPFCGCGTAVASAQKLDRQWIGIDITHLAINLIKHRLEDTYGDGLRYQVIGEPASLPDARKLAEDDPYQFQWWALSLVGARPAEGKKGADRGIDGRLFFKDDESGIFKQVILSVKAGHISTDHLRDLRGVIERDQAQIGVLICMHEPSKPMRIEAASAGFYNSPWGTSHPRLQILTIADLFNGKHIDMPPQRQTNVTFKKARRTGGKSGGRQLEIGE